MRDETKLWITFWICCLAVVVVITTGITAAQFAPSKTPLEQCASSTLIVQQSSFCMEVLHQNHTTQE